MAHKGVLQAGAVLFVVAEHCFFLGQLGLTLAGLLGQTLDLTLYCAAAFLHRRQLSLSRTGSVGGPLFLVEEKLFALFALLQSAV